MVLAELLLLVLLAVAAVFLARGLLGDQRRRQRDRAHLDHLTNTVREDADEPVSPRGPLGRQLRAAGLAIGWPTFAAAIVLAAVLAFLLAGWLAPQLPQLAPAAAALAIVACWVAVSAWAKWRARRFETHLADAVGFMVAALEAGQNATQAFGSAGLSAEGAVVREFARVNRRLELGMDIQPALQPMLDGYDSPGTRLFVQTLIAKWRLGGELAPVLASVARLLRERLRTRLRVRRQLAGARLSAVLIALLPYFSIPLFLRFYPNLISRLVSHPAGPQLLLAGVLLQLAGFLWLRRIFRMEL